MNELNGYRAPTEEEIAEQKDANARHAEHVVHELPSGSCRSVDELDTPRPTVTLEQVLQERTAQLTGGDRSSTQIVAELCALRDAWTSFERVVPSYEYKTRIWLVEHLISLGLVGVEPRGSIGSPQGRVPRSISRRSYVNRRSGYSNYPCWDGHPASKACAQF